jgi:hypothetical protein
MAPNPRVIIPITALFGVRWRIDAVPRATQTLEMIARKADASRAM